MDIDQALAYVKTLREEAKTYQAKYPKGASGTDMELHMYYSGKANAFMEVITFLEGKFDLLQTPPTEV